MPNLPFLDSSNKIYLYLSRLSRSCFSDTHLRRRDGGRECDPCSTRQRSGVSRQHREDDRRPLSDAEAADFELSAQSDIDDGR